MHQHNMLIQVHIIERLQACMTGVETFITVVHRQWTGYNRPKIKPLGLGGAVCVSCGATKQMTSILSHLHHNK